MIVVFLAGCGVDGPEVPLLTGDQGCYAGGETGITATLVADPEHGTTFGGLPVMWPTGYSARRAGDRVVVLDSVGATRAVTGRTYHISRAYSQALGFGVTSPFVAAVDCGYPWDFIDCTANAGNEYCRPD